jgi:hypothetical protein
LETQTYFGDLFADFQNGCRLDLRVKLAIEFTKIMLEHTSINGMRPDTLAAFALDIADNLVRRGTELGLVRLLPDTDELPAAVKHHARRVAAFQVTQQLHAQRLAQAEHPRVQGAN